MVATPSGGEQMLRLDAVMAQSIYTPEADQKLLQNTKAARFDKQNGTSVIGFCIDTNGKTTDIRVVQQFPDDPKIDDIFMQTIEKWRFMPFRIEDQPVKVCTQRTFKLVFKP